MEIKIKEWKELLGRSSKDQWGNDTMIGEVTDEYIEIGTLEPCLCGGHLIRQIHLDDDANGIQGGYERVLSELKHCGFNVRMDVDLTEKQKIEIAYFRDVLEYEWIAQDEGGEVYFYEGKPKKMAFGWDSNTDNYSLANEEYDFLKGSSASLTTGLIFQ